jgi:hypothetical protein
MAVTLTRLPTTNALGTATVDIVLGAPDGRGDTAVPHADYDAALQRVTFGDGVASRMIYVNIVADALTESTEHFAMRLAGLSSSTGRVSLGHPASIVGYIEVARVSFASGAYTASAGQSEARIGLVLSQAIGDPVTVTVAATAGSRTQAVQAVFAALATTASAAVDLDALGFGGSTGGSVALRLAGLATAVTRDADVSPGTATLAVSTSTDGSLVKNWEVPLIVLGALAVLALAVTVAYVVRRLWATPKHGNGSAVALGEMKPAPRAVPAAKIDLVVDSDYQSDSGASSSNSSSSSFSDV